MESFILIFVFAIIVFVLRVVFAVKKGVDLYKKHWDAFNQSTTKQHRILEDLLTISGATSASKAELIQQFMNEQRKAQARARQLDELRRSRASAQMAEVMGMALRAGVEVNPSDYKI